MENKYGSVIDGMHGDGYWMIPKCLTMANISPLALYLFTRMLDHYKYHKNNVHTEETRKDINNGWFYWTYPSIEEATKIKKDQAMSLIKELETVMLIDKDTRRCGVEQRNYYHINEDKIQFYQQKYTLMLNAVVVKTDHDGGKQPPPKEDSATSLVVKPHRNQDLSNQDLSNQDLKKKVKVFETADKTLAVSLPKNNILNQEQAKPSKRNTPVVDSTKSLGVLPNETLCAKVEQPKPIMKWNANDFFYHFCDEFKKNKNEKYIGSVGADSILLKGTYDKVTKPQLKDCIEYYLGPCYTDRAYTVGYFVKALPVIIQQIQNIKKGGEKIKGPDAYLEKFDISKIKTIGGKL